MSNGDSGGSSVGIDREKIPAERLKPTTVCSHCQPVAAAQVGLMGDGNAAILLKNSDLPELAKQIV